MQHQNAAIYVCKEANCQLKTDTESHRARGLCRLALSGCHGLLSYCDCHFSLLEHHRVSLSLCDLATFNNKSKL